MLLDDLLVALRTTAAAQRGAMSCSIDPTREGLVKLQTLVKSLTTMGNAAQTIAAIEETLGPQVITVNGVPDVSHFARVMVAADYKMKRMAMHFEPAPVPGMPSFLEMTKAGPTGIQNMLRVVARASVRCDPGRSEWHGFRAARLQCESGGGRGLPY